MDRLVLLCSCIYYLLVLVLVLVLVPVLVLVHILLVPVLVLVLPRGHLPTYLTLLILPTLLTSLHHSLNFFPLLPYLTRSPKKSE